MALTDVQLVQRARAGDREAFGQLVERYRDMAYGLAYHLTGEFETAQDLAQEAFVQAYLKLAQLRDPEKFAAWLRRIVTNAHRTHGRRPQLPTVALGDEPQPEQHARDLSDVEAAAAQALSRLRAPERLALTLHYINGYSHAEIGRFLGVRPETVKTRLARARQHLRREVVSMVEHAFGSKKLPQDFTQTTVAEALRRGQAAVENEDYEAAMAAFTEAVRLQPGSAQAHAGLGDAWSLRNHHLPDPQAAARARAEYLKALGFDPRCEEALVALAATDAGDKREAFRRALAVLPESVELRYRLAWEIHAAGDTEQAAQMMTAMLDEDVPLTVRVRLHNNLGSFFHDTLGDPATGREHFRLAAEATEALGRSLPAYSPFFHWRVYAWLALRDGQWADAARAATRVLDMAPTDFERRNLHRLLAAAMANLGRADEAISHLAQAADPRAEPPGADRWPFRVPASTNPLEWVRANVAGYFAPIAADPRFRRIMGKSA